MSVKTEESILRAVLEDINATKSNTQTVYGTQENRTELNVKENGEINKEKDYKAELQKQIEIGEITPFEAIFKQSVLEGQKYTFK